jgi:hypothetical protein
MGLFLSLMDTTVVATMLTAISEDFSGFRDAPWIILAYPLSYVGKQAINNGSDAACLLFY